MFILLRPCVISWATVSPINESNILRLQVGTASHQLGLPALVAQVGEPVLYLHLWNESLSQLPEQEPDLAWAKMHQSLFLQSLRLVARQIQWESTLTRVRAVGGVTALFFSEDRIGGARLLRLQRVEFWISKDEFLRRFV